MGNILRVIWIGILGQNHQVTLNCLYAKAHLIEKFGTKGE